MIPLGFAACPPAPSKQPQHPLTTCQCWWSGSSSPAAAPVRGTCTGDTQWQSWHELIPLGEPTLAPDTYHRVTTLGVMGLGGIP